MGFLFLNSNELSIRAILAWQHNAADHGHAAGQPALPPSALRPWRRKVTLHEQWQTLLCPLREVDQMRFPFGSAAAAEAVDTPSRPDLIACFAQTVVRD